MMRFLGIAFSLILVVGFTSELLGHGGTWRGSRKPGYTTPPPAKYPDTPQGPKYPTPPTRPSTPPSTPPTGPTTPPTTPPVAPPSTPTGPSTGPKVPGTAGPTNPGPARPGTPTAPTSGAPVGPVAGPGAAPTAKPTAAAKKPAATDANSNWDTWWEHNRHTLVVVEKASNKANVSGEELAKDAKKSEEMIKNFVRVMAKEYNFDPRTSGAIALGKMANKDNKEVYQALLDGTEDQELQVRESSILALGLLGNKEAMGRLDKILTAADKKEVTERFFAAVALGIIGDNAILPTLKEIISKEKLKEVKVGAVIAIGLMKNEEHIPYLLKISESKNQDDMVRAAAISAIGKIGTFEYTDKNKKVNIVKSLSELVEEKQTSDIVKMSVINAFADVCDKNTLDTVYGWYNKEKDNLARGFMVMAMAKIYTISEDESSKKEVWKLISTEIEKGPFNVRGFCAVAFGIMKDKRAYKILKDRFDNVKDPMIRSSVAVGLGLLGEKSAVPTLLEEIGANSKSTDDLQAYCALALGMIHKADSTPDPQIVDALVLAIKDGKKKPNLMRQSCIALALMGARQQGVKEMVEILKDEDVSVYEKGSAAQALGLFKDESVVETLWSLYDEEFSQGKQKHEYRAFLLIPIGIIKARESVSPVAKIAENFNYTIDFRSVTEMFDIL